VIEKNISSNLDTTNSSRPTGISEICNIANSCSKLKNGEEVYLIQNDKQLFKVRQESCSIQDTVHFQVIGSDLSRFFITKVYQNASLWKDFDEDIHCEGAAILWETAKIKRQDIEGITHESHGQHPVTTRKIRQKKEENRKKLETK